MFRTYKLPNFANQKKLGVILETLKAYQTTAQAIAANQWYLLFTTGYFNKNDKGSSQVSTDLSKRYCQTIQYQVVGELKSYLSNLKNAFRQIVYKSNLSEEDKKELYLINKKQEWFTSGNLVARKIMHHLFKKHRKPSFKNCNMLLDGKQITIEKSNSSTFDYWVKIATIRKGKPIYIPIQSYEYFDKQTGEICKAIQVNYNKQNNELSFCFIKKLEQKEYEPLIDSIALDLGLQYLFTSNYGDLYGRKFYSTIQKYDKLISDLARNRQKQGLKVRSRKYDNLVKNLRNYLKNEINRILNSILNNYRPAEIIIERLNFQKANLSKRLNRILSNFGKGVIKEKLEALKEEYGILITEVNPAYTSQECNKCHYIHKHNRASREKFACLNCGHTSHADVNAARVISHRRSMGEVASIYLSKVNVLRIMRKFFTDSFERPPSCSSSALILMDELPW